MANPIYPASNKPQPLIAWILMQLKQCGLCGLTLLLLLGCAYQPLTATSVVASDVDSENQPPPTASKPIIDTAGFNHGLLWKIEHPDHSQSSYLLGTIHSEDKRVLELTEPMVKAFKQSTDFAMEVLITPQVSQKSQAAMFFNDQQNFESIAGTALYHQAVQAMANLGMPKDQVSHMKPWAIFTLLSMPKPKTGLFLDLMLYKAAKKLDMQVHGLESIDEQIAVFDQMAMEHQLIILQDTLDNLDKMDELFEKTIKTYLSHSLKAVMELNAETMRLNNDSDSVMKAFEDRLITERNKRMTKRIMKLLPRGKIFVAVGTLHLPGEFGILNLLKKEGYTLTALD